MTNSVEEVMQFLSGFKNSESLGTEARRAISVSTGLDATLMAAATDGKSVFVTGTAGSGKTHLLEAARLALAEQGHVVENSSDSKPHVLLITDATALSMRELIDAVIKKPRSRRATVLAINEGPLREAAAHAPDSDFAKALETLRALRVGRYPSEEEMAPAVIDVGAFDPIQGGVIEGILALPVLEEIVSRAPGGRGGGNARSQAWRQLQAPEVRKRVAKILRLVEVVSDRWIFRDLWDLVADMALGGDESSDPPKSVWFWRLFFGRSKISKALRLVMVPTEVPLPILDSRIYFGDWAYLRRNVMAGVDLLPFSRPDLPDVFDWVKAQMLVLGAGSLFEDSIQPRAEAGLFSAVVGGGVEELVRAVNKYMCYGLRPSSKTELSLFVTHAVERHTQRPQGQIKIGSAPVSDFEVRRSLVASHPGHSQSRILGPDLFLVHRNSEASVALSREKLRLLERGRSFRMRDRANTDLDHDLYRFFELVAMSRYRDGLLREPLGILLFDFEESRLEESEYAMSAELGDLEEVGLWRN